MQCAHCYKIFDFGGLDLMQSFFFLNLLIPIMYRCKHFHPHQPCLQGSNQSYEEWNHSVHLEMPAVRHTL